MSGPTRVGPYRVLERLGSGGMGTVYRARSGGRDVAVKTVHAEFAGSREFRERFRQEVHLVRRVRSAHVPRFVGADTEAPVPWLATELVRGASLDRIIGSGPLTGGRAAVLATGVLAALRDLHAQGVMHRDLKPGNVLLGPDGPRVVDFGIARALDGTALTRTGGVVGSSGWIAPERHVHGLSTPAADVFAWGALVAYATTGRPPFGRGAPQAVTARVLGAEPDLDGVPEPLRPLVEAALVKEVDRRPDAAWLLERLLEHDPAARRWLAARPRPRRWRRGSIVAAGAMAVVLAATVGLVAARPWEDTGAETEPEALSEGTSEVGGRNTDPFADSARDRGSNIGYVVEAAAVVDLGTRGWDEDVDRGPHGRFVLDPGPASSSMTVEGMEARDEGVAMTFAAARGNGPVIDGAWFTVVSPEGEVVPASEEGAFGERGRLVFEGAPERGLLVLTSPDHEEDVRGYPPVGVCYDLADGIFSTVYEDCS